MLVAEAGELTSFRNSEIRILFAALEDVPALAVGVSGGSDSLALLALLAQWRTLLGDEAPELTVLSVDHGLRDEARDEVVAVCEIANKWGLKHQAFVWEQNDKSSSNIQARARAARYDLMCGWCEHHAVSHLLVAHTLEDQAETVLMRLARGSGVDGLSAMATFSKRNSILLHRPLLAIRKTKLVEVLTEIDCPHFEDPSNKSLKYDRVRLREALKILAPLGIGAQNLADTAARLQSVREALDVMVLQAISQAVELFDEGYCILHSADLTRFPEEIRRRVVGRLLQAIAGKEYAPEHAALEKLLGWIVSPDNSTRTLGGCVLKTRRHGIWIMREASRGDLPHVRLRPGSSVLWDKRFLVNVEGNDGDLFDVKALGVAHYAKLKAMSGFTSRYPSILAAGLPSFWNAEKLIAVPHLAFQEPEYMCQIEAKFVNFSQF